MGAPRLESTPSLPEPQKAARRSRIAHLALIVFELIRGRYLGGDNREFDGAESAELMAALRACSRYAVHITCDPFVPDSEPVFYVSVQGIDGNPYLIEFTLSRPGFSIQAARVRVAELSMVFGDEGPTEGHSNYYFDSSSPYYTKLSLVSDNVERAFLVGMALVIGFMGDEDEDREESLSALFPWIAPRREELRQIRAKLPPSSISYDEEGDQPF